jgi:hypothetical protein
LKETGAPDARSDETSGSQEESGEEKQETGQHHCVGDVHVGKNHRHGSDDIILEKAADSALECQVLCQGIRKCQMWTWHESITVCVMTRVDFEGAVLENNDDTSSGPKYCVFERLANRDPLTKEEILTESPKHACRHKLEGRRAATITDKKVMTKTGTKDEHWCIFPFEFRSVCYTECTKKGDEGGRLWCSTKTDKKGVHESGKGNWGYCDVPEA